MNILFLLLFICNFSILYFTKKVNKKS
ncbi:hypothetical protein PI27_gp179 [Listeria phage WIL-1]|nr:hypothetical protein PI27_gp179 [Listeria phage WIL-1]